MTRNETIGSLIVAGFYRGDWSVLDDDVYDPLSVVFIRDVAWPAWVASLPDQLKEPREVGGGKTIMVPRWLPEVFDCDSQVADFAIFVARCCAVDAVKMTKTRGNAGGGRFNYRVDGNPAIGHCRYWFVDYDRVVHAFDVGICQIDGMSKPEVESIFSGESI